MLFCTSFATWRRNVLNFYSWICYAAACLSLSLFLVPWLCVCVVNLNLIEKHVTPRHPSCSPPLEPSSQRGLKAEGWRLLLFTWHCDASFGCFLPASLLDVACSLDNVERCASFGAQLWLLTLPHVAAGRAGHEVRLLLVKWFCIDFWRRHLLELPTNQARPLWVFVTAC